jgi:hypothetical protein
MLQFSVWHGASPGRIVDSPRAWLILLVVVTRRISISSLASIIATSGHAERNRIWLSYECNRLSVATRLLCERYRNTIFSQVKKNFQMYFHSINVNYFPLLVSLDNGNENTALNRRCDHLNGGFVAGIGNGSVRLVGKKTHQRAFNPADGQAMGSDW